MRTCSSTQSLVSFQLMTYRSLRAGHSPLTGWNIALVANQDLLGLRVAIANDLPKPYLLHASEGLLRRDGSHDAARGSHDQEKDHMMQHVDHMIRKRIT